MSSLHVWDLEGFGLHPLNPGTYNVDGLNRMFYQANQLGGGMASLMTPGTYRIDSSTLSIKSNVVIAVGPNVSLVSSTTGLAIPALQACIFNFSQLTTINNGFVGDGVTDNAAAFTALNTKYAGTGAVVTFAGGNYAFHGPITINGFYVSLQKDTIWTALDKTNRSITLTGNYVGIIGGKIICPKMKQYQCSAVSSDGANVTFTIGTHDFTVGEVVQSQYVTLTSGSINNIALTISSVTPTTVAVTSAAVVNATAAIPFYQVDGSGQPRYPILYRGRSSNKSEAIIVPIHATNFLIDSVYLQYGANAGIYHSVGSSGGVVRSTTVDGTAADGITFTEAVSDIDVIDCISKNTFDDAFSIVGGSSTGGFISDIRFKGCRVYNSGTRGMTILGARRIRNRDFIVNNAYYSGIYIGVDGGVGTLGCYDIDIDGFTLKTTGNANSSPTGWLAANYGSLEFTPSTTTGYTNDTIRVRNGKLLNCRGTAILGGSTSPSYNCLLENIDIDGCLDGILTFMLSNSKLKNFSIANARGKSVSLGDQGGSLGRNLYEDFDISDSNAGGRVFLSAISAVSGTITLTFGFQTGILFTAGNVVVIRGVTSSASTVVNAKKDLALNDTFTLATVTNSGGNTVSATITGYGGSDSVSPIVNDPAESCPQAYVAKQTGAGSLPAINVAASATDRIMIVRPKVTSVTYPITKFIDIFSTISPSVTVIDPDDNGLDVGSSMDRLATVYPPQEVDVLAINSTDSNQIITVDALRSGLWFRSGISAPRSDTLPPASSTVAAMPNRFEFRYWKFNIVNNSGQPITMVSSAGWTITGSATISASTVATFATAMTNTIAGSETMLAFRMYASPIV